MPNKTITVTLSGPTSVVDRIRALLALLHYSAVWGHSGIFGVPLDGDGADRLTVQGADVEDFRDGVRRITGVGYDVETAQDGGFSGYWIDRDRPRKWSFTPDGKRP